MGIAARQELLDCREGFSFRDAQLARDLACQNIEINRRNRTIFQLAVDVGDDLEVREWAMFKVLVGRCLEQISGNTVDIAERAVFVKTPPTASSMT